MIQKDLLKFYQPVFVVSLIRAVGVDVFEQLAQKAIKKPALDTNARVFELLNLLCEMFIEVVDVESFDVDRNRLGDLFFESSEIRGAGMDVTPFMFVIDAYLQFLRLWMQPMHESYTTEDLEDYLSIADDYDFAKEFRKMVDARFLFPFIVEDDLQLQFDNKFHNFVDAMENIENRRAAMECVNRLLDECFCMQMDFVYK